jgi:hypothetical protein
MAEVYLTDNRKLRAALAEVIEAPSRSACRAIAHRALGHTLVEGEHVDEWVMPSDPAETTPPDAWGR